MALHYALNGDVLHVVETLHDATRTRVRHWYYDIKTWMVSSHGREGDRPDRVMTQSGIDWVKKHYLPKLGAAA